MIKHKDFKHNFLVISNMAKNQINLDGKKVTKEDFFVLKYDGASFDNNRMELHSFYSICRRKYSEFQQKGGSNEFFLII